MGFFSFILKPFKWAWKNWIKSEAVKFSTRYKDVFVTIVLDVALSKISGDSNRQQEAVARAKLELDLTGQYKDRFIGQWNQNRVGVDYKPDDDKTSDQDSNLMNGIHRADFRQYSGKISTDHAVDEPLHRAGLVERLAQRDGAPVHEQNAPVDEVTYRVPFRGAGDDHDDRTEHGDGRQAHPELVQHNPGDDGEPHRTRPVKAR